MTPPTGFFEHQFDPSYAGAMPGGMNGKNVDAARVIDRVTSAGDAQRARQVPRHCWIDGLPGVPNQTPGLLIAWNNEVGSWSGRVIYSVEAEGGPMIIHRWLSSTFLRPSDT